MDSRFRTALDWKSNARQSSHSAERMILDGAILYTVAAGYPAHWQNSETSALSNVLNLILSPTSACCPDDDLGLMDLFCRTLHAEFLQEEEISHDEVDNPKVAFQQWLLHQTQLALTTQSKEKADSFLRSPGSEFEHAMHNLLVAGQTALLRDFFVEFQEPVWQNLATILKKDLLGEEFQLYWSVYERNIFQQSWTDVCTNRALLRTESGFLGLGPLQARPGDLICIVKGAAVPYLFRKYQTGSDSVYELLGDVYLHGIMYGERSSELTWGEMVVR
jgi:hypothetical protein